MTLISHKKTEIDMAAAVAAIENRIIVAGNNSEVTVAEKLRYLQELAEFDLGRFLILHGGLNGYWTHYILTYPQRKQDLLSRGEAENLTNLELLLLNSFPVTLATQERYQIFLQESQNCVHDNVKLACIPSGLMGELLYLNYENANNFELWGFDLDQDALDAAAQLADARDLADNIKLVNKNAWEINVKNKFHLISSNGLNIYEANTEKVTELYKIFYAALVPGGKLVSSFLTFPPVIDATKTEWRMEKIDKEMLRLQKIIFSDILQAQFVCFQSSGQIKEQLELVGFKDIKFIADVANMFPTVVAKK